MEEKRRKKRSVREKKKKKRKGEEKTRQRRDVTSAFVWTCLREEGRRGPGKRPRPRRPRLHFSCTFCSLYTLLPPHEVLFQEWQERFPGRSESRPANQTTRFDSSPCKRAFFGKRLSPVATFFFVCRGLKRATSDERRDYKEISTCRKRCRAKWTRPRCPAVVQRRLPKELLKAGRMGLSRAARSPKNSQACTFIAQAEMRPLFEGEKQKKNIASTEAVCLVDIEGLTRRKSTDVGIVWNKRRRAVDKRYDWLQCSRPCIKAGAHSSHCKQLLSTPRPSCRGRFVSNLSKVRESTAILPVRRLIGLERLLPHFSRRVLALAAANKEHFVSPNGRRRLSFESLNGVLLVLILSRITCCMETCVGREISQKGRRTPPSSRRLLRKLHVHMLCLSSVSRFLATPNPQEAPVSLRAYTSS